MERPYVICHILSSLDGKITGPFMGTESVGALGAGYGKYRTEMNADAWLYGPTTTKEFTGFRKPVLEEAGEIGWESGIFRNKGRVPAHVIEVLTASTPAEYEERINTHFMTIS